MSGHRTDIVHCRPGSLVEAVATRAEHPDWLVLAGGTDLMLDLDRRGDPQGVLDLFGSPELAGVATDGQRVRIGAVTTVAALIDDATIAVHLPLLQAAAREVGAVQIQERATIGGNIVTSSPVGDLLPGLLALDAEVELRSIHGVRRVPYASFCTGYRTIDLADDELLVAVAVPVPRPGTRQRWRKVGTRRAQAISTVSFAGVARLDDGVIVHARLALGAVADRPIRVHAAEALLIGQRPSTELAAQVRAVVIESIHPIDDVRSTADHRRTVAANLVRRAVQEWALG